MNSTVAFPSISRRHFQVALGFVIENVVKFDYYFTPNCEECGNLSLSPIIYLGFQRSICIIHNIVSSPEYLKIQILCTFSKILYGLDHIWSLLTRSSPKTSSWKSHNSKFQLPLHFWPKTTFLLSNLRRQRRSRCFASINSNPFLFIFFHSWKLQ